MQETNNSTPKRTLGSVFHPNEIHELDMFEARTARDQARRAEQAPNPTRRLFDMLENLPVGRLAAVGVLAGGLAVSGYGINRAAKVEYQPRNPSITHTNPASVENK